MSQRQDLLTEVGKKEAAKSMYTQIGSSKKNLCQDGTRTSR